VQRSGCITRTHALTEIAGITLKGVCYQPRWTSEVAQRALRQNPEAPVPPCYRTWLDLTLADGELTFLEADESELDPEKARRQLMPVAVELSRSLSIGWRWAGFAGRADDSPAPGPGSGDVG
jgi:hypothetical protein